MQAVGPSVNAALEVGTCQAVLLTNRQALTPTGIQSKDQSRSQWEASHERDLSTSL